MQERTPPLRSSPARGPSSENIRSEGVTTETESANGEVSATLPAGSSGAADTSVEEVVGPGLVIDDKYEVIGFLGRGGMGSVFLAKNRALDAPVAIKVLSRELARRGDGADRLLREARAAAKLNHPNVVRVFDVGRLETGSPFIVMERLVGADLEQVLRERSSLPSAEAAGYVAEACRGLAHAHERGFVHRDLKPANLFVCHDGPEPTIKLLDFGISKPASASSVEGDLTQDGDLLGSPHYMSPEQLRSSRSVDHRTDIWALGVILYRLVTGTHPFHARGLAGLAVAIATDPPKPPSQDRPRLPSALERIILRCLEKDASRRYASATELERALSAFVAHPTRAVPSATKMAVVVALLLLLVIAIIGWSLSSPTTDPAPAPDTKIASEPDTKTHGAPSPTPSVGVPAPAPVASSARVQATPAPSVSQRTRTRPPQPRTPESAPARGALSHPKAASSTPAPGTLVLSGNPAVDERE
jgi:eukaryotic-like serine/threonine-protein kinase